MKAKYLVLVLALLSLIVSMIIVFGPAPSRHEEIKKEVKEIESQKEIGEAPLFLRASGFNAQYCKTEVLRWKYDISTKSLRFSDERVYLNSCGVRKIQAFRTSSGTIQLFETDDMA